MLGALAALLPAGAAAQQSDARQRTTETIVADGLAQLPAADAKVFNQVMGELAATGSKGVEMIAAMLVPADKGKNATFEYALNGVVAYVTDPAHEALRDDVRKGLLAAIDRCGDDANRAFLFSQLQFCSTAADAAAMARYLDDPYLADYALRALVSTPGTEALLLAEAGKDDLTAARKQALAYAFAEKRLAAAEPFLLTWLEGADAQTAEQIYNALAACGSQASVKPLAAAAAKTGCAWNDAGAADAYLRLLARLAAAGDARAVKAARGLLKCDLQYIRGGALAILVDALGAGKAMPYVLKAVEEGPAEYRYAALQSLGKGDDKLFAQVAAGMPRYDAAAQAAVIGWLGECGAVSQADVITAAVASPDDRVAEAAIAASGRIGGEKALRALAGALEGPHAGAAMKALLAFNGQINPEVGRLLAQDDAAALVPALKLAAARRMSAAADRVFALLGSSDAEVRAAAYGALPFVAQPQHMDRLSALLDASDEAHTAAIQSALIRTSGQLPADRRYGAVAGYMKASETPARYYPVLAQSGTQGGCRQPARRVPLREPRRGFRRPADGRKSCHDRYPLRDRCRKSDAHRPRPDALCRPGFAGRRDPDPPLPALQTGSRTQAFGRRAGQIARLPFGRIRPPGTDAGRRIPRRCADRRPGRRGREDHRCQVQPDARRRSCPQGFGAGARGL